MKKGTRKYEFVKDYPLGGKKKGDPILLARVSTSLKSYVKAVDEEEVEEEEQDYPTKEWVNDDIVQWLAANGVPNAKGTKDELLKEVKKVLKA